MRGRTRPCLSAFALSRLPCDTLSHPLLWWTLNEWMMGLFKNEGLCCFWFTSSTTRSISLWALCKIHFGCWQVLWPQSEQTGNLEDSISPMDTPHWWAGVRSLHKCVVIFIRLQGPFFFLSAAWTAVCIWPSPFFPHSFGNYSRLYI